MENTEIDFKAIYNEQKEKYNLPGFKEISEDFDIEKITDKETEFLVREVRRTINEKIGAYIHLFETLINPGQSPMFLFSILRGISKKDKETVKEMYEKLSKTQIEVMKLDTIYNEEAEAKFINKMFSLWQELKPTIYKLIESFEADSKKDDASKGRSYFD